MYIYFVLLLVGIGEVASSMSPNNRFEQIVDKNLTNPNEIVNQLNAWKIESNGDFPEVAQAFLSNFGGKDFGEEEEEAGKQYNSEPEEQQELKEVALRIGSSLRKLGASEINDTTKLKAARRFLGFYYEGSSKGQGENGFFDSDVSPSLILDQLNDMIKNGDSYIKSVKDLKDYIKSGIDQTQDSEESDFGCLSDDDTL